jgi:hypothetical protein
MDRRPHYSAVSRQSMPSFENDMSCRGIAGHCPAQDLPGPRRRLSQGIEKWEVQISEGSKTCPSILEYAELSLVMMTGDLGRGVLISGEYCAHLDALFHVQKL